MGDVVVAGQHIGAHCNHTYSSASRNILKADWDKMRVGYLCSDSTGFTDTETVIDQFCTIYPTVCDYETRAVVTTFLLHMNSLRKTAGRAKRHAKLMSEDFSVKAPAPLSR